jgi:hypothetical protein
MRKLLTVISIFLYLIILFSGCSTKCPSFESSILEWMPYKEHDKIILSNGSETDTLIVTSSQIEHTDRMAFGTRCACSNMFYLHLSSDSLNIQGSFHDSRIVEQSSFVINTWNFYFSELRDTMEIDGLIYSDLIVYHNTDTMYSHFEKIIISKSIGIVAIIGTNEEWKLVDNSNKQVKISDLKMQIHNCGL